MKISILTLGCRTNQAESIYLQKSLSQKGYTIVNFSEKPDICIINTCAVTKEAERQSRQLISRAVSKGVKTYITGCYGELKGHEWEKNNLFFIKNKEKDKIIHILPSNTSTNTLNNTNILRQRPIIKVQEGCDNSCTYCSIPITRGKPRSIPIKNIIDEIIYYQEKGFKEIVLTGTHLGSFGKDLDPKKNLSILIQEILKRSSIPRIRLSSLDITEIDKELLEIMESDRICKHLHLPLQSGDDYILKLMKRQYTLGDYESVINKIIAKFPNISIGTDVIVGFPGETEHHFRNTIRFIKSMPYSYIHVFPYSKRPYTVASKLPNQVADSIKKRRASELRYLGKIMKINYIKKFIDKTLDVLIEEYNNGLYNGTSGNYIKVLINHNQMINIGSIVKTKITSMDETNAIGKIELIE